MERRDGDIDAMVRITGMHFPNLDGSSRVEVARKHWGPNANVRLRREPKNKYDANAIAVDLKAPGGWSCIGYLGRDDAKEIAAHLDRGGHVAVYPGRAKIEPDNEYPTAWINVQASSFAKPAAPESAPFETSPSPIAPPTYVSTTRTTAARQGYGPVTLGCFGLLLLVGVFWAGNAWLDVLAALGNRASPSSAAVLPTLAPTPTPTPRPTATVTPGATGFSRNQPASVGATVETGDYTYTLVALRREAFEHSGLGISPQPGNENILVTVSARCNKRGENKCNLSLVDFEVVADDGIVRPPNYNYANFPEMLLTTQFLPGATLTGGVVFEVPRGKSVTLEIKGGLNAKAVYWRLP